MRVAAAALIIFLGFGQASAATLRLVDDVGSTVVITGVPQRVVCLSPGATEIIFALGAGDRLKAVCGLCDFPPPARVLPKTGDFLTVSVESVLGARPDLVVATGGVQKEVVLRLRGSHVPVLVLYPHSVEGIIANIRLLGRALGKEGEAKQVARRIESQVAAITERIRKNKSPRVRVYFEVSPDPLIAAGGMGYVGELISLAGGDNVVSGGDEEYPRISPEFVVSRDPEVIIISHATDSAKALEMLRARPGWEKVSAVRNGRVYADINMDMVMRPGPRVSAGLAQLNRRLAPPR